jgi:hypothetical protein
MTEIHVRCAKCRKFSEPIGYTIHERFPDPPNWMTVIIRTDINRYREVLFCPDCLPALLKEIPP